LVVNDNSWLPSVSHHDLRIAPKNMGINRKFLCSWSSSGAPTIRRGRAAQEFVMVRNATSQRPVQGLGGRDRLADGPNMIVLLFVLALVISVLAGLGARHMTHRPDRGHAAPNGDISAEATRLGYRNERDFRIDQEHASLALADVLAAEPGAQRLWENAETGNRGVIWASEETRQPGGASCRNLARRTLINSAFRNAEGIACRSGAGWEQTGGWRAD
jgi:hypothetical protein